MTLNGPNFVIAPVQNVLHIFDYFINLKPAYFAIDAFQGEGPCRIKMHRGTTTLAFRFKEGVIVAVDSRATSGPYIGFISLNVPHLFF